MNLLPQYATEGRIVRYHWSRKGADGRELLCLYTAIAGNRRARPDECPKRLMPKWLAHLLPWFDDRGTEVAWPGMVSRWAAVSDRLGLLVGERGDRLRCRWLASMIRERPETLAGNMALKLFDRQAVGEVVTDDEWWSVRAESLKAGPLTNAAVWGLTWHDRDRDLTYQVGRAVATLATGSSLVQVKWDRVTDLLLTLIEEEVGP